MASKRDITLAPYSKGGKADQKKSYKIFKSACDKAVSATKSTANKFKDLGHSIEKRLGVDTPEGRQQVKEEIKLKCKAAADMTKTGAAYGAGVAVQHGKAFKTFAKGVKESFIASRKNFAQNYMAYLEANAETNDLARQKLATMQAKMAYKEAKESMKAARDAYRTQSTSGFRNMWESAKERFGWSELKANDPRNASIVDEKGETKVEKPEVKPVEQVAETPEEKHSREVAAAAFDNHRIDEIGQNASSPEPLFDNPDSVFARAAESAKAKVSEGAALDKDSTVTSLSAISQKLYEDSQKDSMTIMKELLEKLKSYNKELQDYRERLQEINNHNQIADRLATFQANVAVPEEVQDSVEAQAAL